MATSSGSGSGFAGAAACSFAALERAEFSFFEDSGFAVSFSAGASEDAVVFSAGVFAAVGPDCGPEGFVACGVATDDAGVTAVAAVWLP